MRSSPHFTKHGKYKKYLQSQSVSSHDDSNMDATMSDDSSDTLVNVPITKRVESNGESHSLQTQPLVFSGLIGPSTNGGNYFATDDSCNTTVLDVGTESSSYSRSNGLANGIHPDTIIAQVRVTPTRSTFEEGTPVQQSSMPSAHQHMYSNGEWMGNQENGPSRLNEYEDINMPRTEAYNQSQTQNGFTEHQHQSSYQDTSYRPTYQPMPESSPPRHFQRNPTSRNDDGTCIGMDVHKFLLECCKMLNDEFVFRNPLFRTCLIPLCSAQNAIIESHEQFLSDLVSKGHDHHDATYCQLHQTTRENTTGEQQTPQNQPHDFNGPGQSNDNCPT